MEFTARQTLVGNPRVGSSSRSTCTSAWELVAAAPIIAHLEELAGVNGTPISRTPLDSPAGSGPQHSIRWGLGPEFSGASGRLLRLKEGSLYPALYRLEAAGEVKAVWEPEPHGRRGARRRIYRLTTKGQRKLDAGRVEWQQFARVLGGILGAPA